MACNECLFTDYVSCDLDSIKINGKLEPGTEYKYEVKDRFGNVYRKTFTTDTDGFWSLAKSDFPSGFFGHGNRFTVSVQDADGKKVNMAVQSSESCIEIQTKNVTGDLKNEIGLNV